MSDHPIASRVYRLVSRPPMPEHEVEVTPGLTVPAYVLESAEHVADQGERFFARFPPLLDVRDRSVLDVGCGAGALCLEAARRGAARVVGVDIDEHYIRLGRHLLADEPLAARITLDAYGGDPRELGRERFDVVLSKDCFEHYGAAPDSPSPEEMVAAMRDVLVPGGLLVIGFAPLWKAPFGGHIDVRMPWAHLVFPEEVVFDEFRRARPAGKTARTFEEGVGVNRMTLVRFRRIMDGCGLEPLHFEVNAGDSPKVRALSAMRRVAPPLREHLTQSVYGIWRRPG